MFIIVGLGNPGKEYENTRHNMGFKTLDILSEKTNIKIEKIKFHSLIGEGRLDGEKLVLVKPQTYMNNSGIAVREIMSFYKVEPENLLVIYDDVDLEAGTMRIRPFGSSGTHNGMRSVVGELNSDRFPRIRIGIGNANRNIIDYVIGKVSSDELNGYQKVWELAADAACCFVREGISLAMNKYNPKRRKPEKDNEEES